MSKIFEFEIPFISEYENNLVSTNKVMINMKVPLENGEHIVTSELLDLGIVKGINQNLKCQFTLWYVYNEIDKTFKLCSSDFISEKSFKLQIFDNSGSEIYKTSTYVDASNISDKYNGIFNKDIKEMLNESIRKANDLIIEKAKDLGLTLLVCTNCPQIVGEDGDNLYVAYDNDIYDGFYEEGKEYSGDLKKVPLQSVWGGHVFFAPADRFANVIGSTGDHNIGGLSWIGLWESQFGVANICTSSGYAGAPLCNLGLFYGGHVISGMVAQQVPYGSNNVYIMPICPAHNNNNNIHMAPIHYNTGVWLNNYHNP